MTASKAFRLFLYRGDDETDANGKPSKSLQELARESRARSPTSPSGSNKAQLFKRALRAVSCQWARPVQKNGLSQA